MTESVKPASHHDTLPGRWIAEPSVATAGNNAWAPVLIHEGLRETAGGSAARAACSPQTVGTCSGEWVPFGRGRDQARDQQEDDMRSLVFETTPLDAPIEILGAPMVTLDVASDRPIANLVVRLCDVHPSGEFLCVSYGVLNLTHREGHEQPAPLAIGERYRVRIQLNDTGSVFPAGHKVRLAISTVTRSPVQEKARVWRLPSLGGRCRQIEHAGKNLHSPALRTGARSSASKPTREAIHHSSRRCSGRTHRPHWSGIGHAVQDRISRREERPAQRRCRAAPDADSVAKRMANPGRDANATVIHTR